jgi:hypothetical protein
LAGERAAHQEQLAADRATVELVTLAQRLADLAARPWWRRLAG